MPNLNPIPVERTDAPRDAVPAHGHDDPPLDREAALREILQLMQRWQIAPEELVDPAERQAALGNARRLVAFWRIEPEELEGPPPVRPPPQSPYRYTHPVTGQSWNGIGPQPDWLRRCLLSEGYRLDEVRTPTNAGLNG